MSNGIYYSTDNILDIPLSMIVKCHFSYIASQATKANIIIAQHNFL